MLLCALAVLSHLCQVPHLYVALDKNVCQMKKYNVNVT